MSLAGTVHPSSQWWAQLPGPHIQEGGGSGQARGDWGSALLEEGIYEGWSRALPTSLEGEGLIACGQAVS